MKTAFSLEFCQLGLWPVSYLLRMECRNSMMFVEDLVFFNLLVCLQNYSYPSILGGDWRFGHTIGCFNENRFTTIHY